MYREVFEKVAAEDSQYMEQDDEPMPTFGKGTFGTRQSSN